MQNYYTHRIIIGSHWLNLYGTDDRHAYRVTARWLSLFWEQLKLDSPGSIAYAVNQGWYETDPVLKIGRLLANSAGVFPCKAYTTLHEFSINDRSIAEFDRVYR